MQQPLFPGISPSENHKDGNNQKTISRDALNKPQYEAVTHISGPLLVVAGAGSGKTRTLVYRVAHLLEQGIWHRSLFFFSLLRAGRPRRCSSGPDVCPANPAAGLSEALFTQHPTCCCEDMDTI